MFLYDLLWAEVLEKWMVGLCFKKKKKRSSKLTLESFQLAILSSKTTGHFTKGLRKEKSQNYNSGFEDCGSANYKPKVTASFHQ